MRTGLTVNIGVQVIFPILMWNSSLNAFHLSINSLSKNFDNFSHLINELKLEFDILYILESKTLKSQSLNTKVSLQNYVIEQTSTESAAGGALL